MRITCLAFLLFALATCSAAKRMHFEGQVKENDMKPIEDPRPSLPSTPQAAPPVVLMTIFDAPRFCPPGQRLAGNRCRTVIN